jgi:hypothetical protein
MIDAFFWYTGVVFWILAAAAAALFIAAEASDRSIRRSKPLRSKSATTST